MAGCRRQAGPDRVSSATGARTQAGGLEARGLGPSGDRGAGVVGPGGPVHQMGPPVWGWTAWRPSAGPGTPVDPRYWQESVTTHGPSLWCGGALALAYAVAGCRPTPRGRARCGAASGVCWEGPKGGTNPSTSGPQSTDLVRRWSSRAGWRLGASLRSSSCRDRWAWRQQRQVPAYTCPPSLCLAQPCWPRRRRGLPDAPLGGWDSGTSR